MINTIIIDDNIEYIKSLINSVICNLKNIRITHILTDGKEALNIIENNTVDLILLDLKMPRMNGIELINKIKQMNSLNIPKIIVISGEVDYMYCLKNELIISDIINKNNMQNIKIHLENTVNNIDFLNEEHIIREKIINELMNLGYNFKYKGTHYIFDSILYIYMSNNLELLNNIEKNVYIYISNKYHKSINNIKTNIIKATKIMVSDNGLKENLTPKIVINNILIKLIN